MDKRLIFLEGAYDTLDLFAEELRRIYEEMGCETTVIYAAQIEEDAGRLMQFAARKVDAVITFNNLGFYLELAEGKNLWEELGIHCINILMDHPFRYHRFLLHAPANGIVLCTDKNHVEYIRRFLPEYQKNRLSSAWRDPASGREAAGCKAECGRTLCGQSFALCRRGAGSGSGGHLVV